MHGEISKILQPAKQTAKRIGLQLGDLFKERINYLAGYCAHEEIYLVLWTRLKSLTKEKLKRATKDKRKQINKQKLPPLKLTQNLIAVIPRSS